VIADIRAYMALSACVVQTVQRVEGDFPRWESRMHELGHTSVSIWGDPAASNDMLMILRGAIQPRGQSHWLRDLCEITGRFRRTP
jgi:hypothetical protein